MAEQAVQTVLFPARFVKPLVATFDTPQQSSGGGANLFKAIESVIPCRATGAAAP